MAHVQKFSRGAATRIIEHCEREVGKDGKHRKYMTGSNIDDARTKDNYQFMLKGFAPNGKDRLNQILSETHCMNRNDVNVMADWVITLPKDYDGDEREFFKACSLFIINRYSKESYIGGWVHKDESQPHIHLCFVPRTYDEKKDRWKVCAKSVLDKKELSSFHNDLEEYLMKRGLVVKGQILNGVTKRTGGNKTIPELKELTERVGRVRDLVKKLDEYIPEEDVEEISGLLKEISNGICGDNVTGPEFEISPTVLHRKEKVR